MTGKLVSSDSDRPVRLGPRHHYMRMRSHEERLLQEIQKREDITKELLD